jgi:phage shock protein C
MKEGNPMEKKLYKNSDKKMISGVLAGFSDYFNMDVTVIRILYVLVSLMIQGFPGIILYIILAIVMPDIHEADRPERNRRQEGSYTSYGTPKSDPEGQRPYQDVQYKENPKPEEVQDSFKKSGGSYTPNDRP